MRRLGPVVLVFVTADVLIGIFAWLAPAAWWVFLGAVAAEATYWVTCVRVVRQGRAGNIERWGRFLRTAGPGVYPLVPFADRMRPLIDMREQHLTILADVVTRDDVDVRTDVAVFFQVFDPERAAYAVRDYHRMLEKLAVTGLREEVAELTLQEFLTSRRAVNRVVRGEVVGTAVTWGIRVTRVEITVIEIPPAIKGAMDDREAAILRANGEAAAIQEVATAVGEPGNARAKLLFEFIRGLAGAHWVQDGSDHSHAGQRPVR